MRDCLILGSGRSGTSLLAGILHQAGYFVGERVHRPRESNPKGFFEWYRVNRINEEILAPHTRARFGDRVARALLRRHTVRSPAPNQRWLAAIPVSTVVASSAPNLSAEIRDVVSLRPFCYKDPRLTYTLPVWRPLLPVGTVSICVFRDPLATAASILRECRSQPYLASLRMTRKAALRVWSCLYRHALRHHQETGEIVFVHYDQVFDGSALPGLENRLEARLDGSFADPALRRSVAVGAPPGEVRTLYEALCRLARYEVRLTASRAAE